jgi:hypothetical protein
MSLALTISFHGGKHHDNLESFPGGTPILDPSGVTLDELRGFTLGPSGDGHLYVVVANKDLSQILRFDPPSAPGKPYANGKIFTASHLHHPFDAVWGPDGNLYVSNQDAADDGKIKITKYDASGKHLGDFANGFKELRGLTWAGNTLYAADEQGGTKGTGTVTPYDLDGSARTPIEVPDPVHIVYDGARYVYIGSNGTSSVYVYDTAKTISPNPAVLITSTGPAPIDATGGIAVASDAGVTTMFVANRKGNAINGYTLDATVAPPVASCGVVWAGGLPDSPEFVAVLGKGVSG